MDQPGGGRKPLEHYLSLQYTCVARAQREGGYAITFPDLPGCLSQADNLQQLPHMAAEAQRGWIETEYEEGREIPEPTYPDEDGNGNGRKLHFSETFLEDLRTRLEERRQREAMETMVLEEGERGIPLGTPPDTLQEQRPAG